MRRVGNHAVLDRFGQSRSTMRCRERREHLDVGEHHGGRVKCADEILPRGRVDAGLAAHRRVDHREQRRGALHDGHAAHERGGDEAREVADDAAAQRDDGGVARAAGGEQLVGDARPRVARLVRFARGHDVERHAPVRRERGDERLCVERADLIIGDHGVAVRGSRGRDERRELRAKPRRDAHRVGARVDRAAAPVMHRRRHYQVTSPAPARRLARRASVNSRSESRLR